MKFYLAPMEGITGYIYRNAYHQVFHSLDKYFTPFLVPNQNKTLKSREINDILQEHNQGLQIVPQILTNNSEDFIWTTNKCQQLGYNEVNLNLGCPSKTVVTKNKGSGFLALQYELNLFLEQVFHKINHGMSISIKTRIGRDNPDEFYHLLEIFNQYPLSELIIHPRIQQDYYKNKPNHQIFQFAMENSKNSVCYNGDIFTVKDYKQLCQSFPDIESVMIGRGIIANPEFIDWILGNSNGDKNKLRDFHDRVYSGYQKIMPGDRNVLFKMKELWFYMIRIFKDSDKYGKKLRKSVKLKAYEDVVDAIFKDLELEQEYQLKLN